MPASCPRCGSQDVQELTHGSARCRSCLHTFRTDNPLERDECRSCGQQVLGERDASGLFRCFHCLEAARAPQGVEDRLFEPVAAPMPGQQVIR